MNLLHRVFALVFIFALLPACAQLPLGIEDPEVRLKGVTLMPVSGLEQKVKVQLELYNPNSIKLPIKSVRYELALDGFKMITGSTSNIGSIPAKGKKPFSVTAKVNLLGGLQMLNSMVKNRSKELNYKLGAEVNIDLPLAPSVTVTREGKVPLR